MPDSREERLELEEVVKGFVAGNSVQFRIVLVKVTQFVYHQLSGTTAEKDDVISEVLEILLDSLRHDRFHGDNLKAFNVYIYSIVRHRVNRVLRRRAKIHYTDEPGEVVDAGLSPLEETSQKQMAEKIMTAMDPKCRHLMKLKFLLCWSDQEIADSIRKTKNATSTAITRCLKKAQELEFVREAL